MKIRLQLILSACIVNFGWAALQSPSQIKNKAVNSAAKDGTEIRQNFHSLFDSIANNEASRNRQYREVLREEVGKGQAAFSTLDKELLNARSLYADRKRYEHENVGVRQNVVAKKREAVETKEFKREESDRDDMHIDEKKDSTNHTTQISNETAINQTSPNLDSDRTTSESTTTTNVRQNLSSDSSAERMPITASPFCVTETPFSPQPPQGLLDKTLPSKKLEEWISITPRIYAEPMCVISRGYFSNVKLAVNDTYMNWKCEIYYCDKAGELKNYKCEFLNSEAGHNVDVNLDKALKECKKVWCI